MAIFTGTDWNDDRLSGTGSIIDLTQGEVMVLGHGLNMVVNRYIALEDMFASGHTADEIVTASGGLLQHGRTGQMHEIVTMANADNIDRLARVLEQVSEAISALNAGANLDVVTADSVSDGERIDLTREANEACPVCTDQDDHELTQGTGCAECDWTGIALTDAII